MAKTWQELADEAIKAGYVPGNHWETLLRRSLLRGRPALAKELGEELGPYLAVQAHRALEQYHRLTEQGTHPEVARELALAELLGSGSETE